MIIHLDADAFFASTEQATDSRLRGKPVAVGGSKRGIVASASYEARKMGVYTPMPTARALKICPKLIVVPGDYEKYEFFSRRMFGYAYDFTPHVEIGGIDEGYFNVRGSKGQPVEIAAKVRDAIRDTLKITVSEGIAPNKLVSQIASKLNKPAGFLEVAAGFERTFLSPLRNTWLPGVGPKMGQILDSAGLAQIHQIANTPPDQLALFTGSLAHQLWQYAQGIDNRPLVEEAADAKTYGHQETFNQDSTDEVFILAKLNSLADQLMTKIREDKKMIRTISVRVRYNDMDEETRSYSLQEPTNYEGDVYPELAKLLRKAWSRRVSLRLVSVKLSHVYDAIFGSELHLDNGLDQSRKLDLSRAVDRIRENFGRTAIMRGHDLMLQKYQRPRVPQPVRAAKVTANRATTVFLNFKTYYSFLDSLLSPKDIVDLAIKKGLAAIAVTDSNLHGCLQVYQAAKTAGIRCIIAGSFQCEGKSFNAYVKDQTGYQNLCHLLSLPKVIKAELEGHSLGLLIAEAERCGPEIRYLQPSDKIFYNVCQSIRTLTLVRDRHADKKTAPFYFRAEPPADGNLISEILDQCRFEFSLGGLKFPHFHPPDGSSPTAFLRHQTMQGAQKRYGAALQTVLPQLEEELSIIAQVGYEEYFLLTWDLLQRCREKGIDWLTRGSAADSMVCYCLEISSVCPIRFELYFRRFLNIDRMSMNKLPDIDIDFPHDRKDDVVELIFEIYGTEHAAIVGGFSTFQGRSAVAEIAKVLGVAESQIRRLTEHIPRTSAAHVQSAIEDSLECRDLVISDDPYKTAISLAKRLDGFPRHPKMHPCGVVLSREPVHSLSPTFISNKGWATTHFDMDDVEAVGLVKMDILAQGGLAVMRDTLRILREKGIELSLEGLEPWKNPEIWEMIQRGGSRGVHHIESPAMIALCKMCMVDNIDDLVAIVSVIRPGAANSLKKLQFARRCQGLEGVEYIHPSLEPVLRSTHGIIAYEEHILQIGEAFANMPPGRGDILRRALVKENLPMVEKMAQEFAEFAHANGRTEEEIRAVWELVSGFHGYAFCRAHSTAYGVEAYQAAHLKRYHPAEFLACVLENGKGFYNRLVYSIECRRLGILFLHPSVNSVHDHFRPEQSAIRVPLKAIKGLSTATLDRWAVERKRGAFSSATDFCQRVGPNRDEMKALIDVGGFDDLNPSRSALHWEWRRFTQWPCELGQGILFGKQEGPLPEDRTEPSLLDRLALEMDLLDFTVSEHPLALHDKIEWESYCPLSNLANFVNQQVTVCGLNIEDRLHHQVDGKLMKFISICDWTGIMECEIFGEVYSRFGIETIRHPVIEVTAVVKPFDNLNGFSLEVKELRSPRMTV